ncbi:MAG: MFS transporter [Candidatus Rokuibacteriota bacterium]
MEAQSAVDAAVSRWVLPTSLFLGTFAWSFTFVSLPFYVERLSTLDAAATLRWSGWILGITPLVTVTTAPLWGRLAVHASPKRLYVAVEVLQGLGFFGMALAPTLPELLLARMLLGITGAASTFAFIIVGRAGGDVRRDVSAIQSGMTVGQVLGPLAGAVVAARVGFQPSFVIGGLILWGCALLVGLAVPAPATREPSDRRSGRASLRDLATVCLLVLAGSTQIFFLPAILPQILPPLGVAPADTLEAGGLIIFATGVAAALGAFAAPRLGDVLGDQRSVTWLLGGSSVFLAALALAPEVWSFGALRFVHVLAVAPVFPLAVAAIAPRASGEAIGFVNSSRIGAAFVGPVLATTLLAWGRPSLVYITLAGVGLALLPLLRRGSARYPSGSASGGSPT